jgi:hypothetical protein
VAVFIVCSQLMDGLFNIFSESIRDLFIQGITSNFTGMFDEVNAREGDIAAQVGQTPEGWGVCC